MEAPERGALNLVRITGVMLVVATILELGLYWAECVYHKPEPIKVSLVPCLWKLIPALFGFVVLFKARAIAEWISDQLDL
jgi:hypothetical protein